MFSIPKKRAGLFIPFAVFGVLGSALGVGGKAWDWIETRKKAAVQEELRRKAVDDRLRSLERWKCKMGGHPPDSIDWKRPCDKLGDDAN